MIRLSTKQLNRLASLAILPLMALAIVFGSRFASSSAAKADPPREGTLVVANLRAESLTFLDLEHGTRRDLGLVGPPHELVSAGSRLYATLGRADSLVEVEPRAPGILRTLHLEGEPHGLALDASADLLVTLDKGNALVSIDRTTLAETSRQATADTPHTVAFADGLAYVTASRAGTLQALPGSASTATGAMPESVAITSRFIVTADVDAGALSVFDRATLAPVRSINVGGRPVRVVALDATHVLATLNGAARLVLVDVSSGKVQKRVETLGHPDGICLSPSGAYVAVASNESDAVQVFRRSDWALAATLEAADGPGSCLWIG